MGDVILLDLEWSNEAKHKQMFTDLFMFSGDERLPVKLRLDQLAYNVFVEEYPKSADFIVKETEKSWIFEAEMASYIGISRFVLGLFGHIEVIESPAFYDYLKKEIQMMSEKAGL